MKDQYIKMSGNRSMNSSMNNKSQLSSRLKVIEFLKDQLYPTGKRSLFFFVLSK